jgi:hypothetical protein
MAGRRRGALVLRAGVALVCMAVLFLSSCPNDVIHLVKRPIIGVSQDTQAIAPGGGFDFGTVPAGATKVVEFAVANTGTAALNLTAPSLVALWGSSAFTVTVPPSAAVASGATTTFTIQFAPLTTGDQGATAILQSDDPEHGDFTIALSGSGSGAVVLTDAQCVAWDKDALAIGYATGDSAAAVTANLTLPTGGAQGSNIGWTSNRGEVVSTAGGVTRPVAAAADVDVTLTATISKGAENDTKVFDLTVLKVPMTDAEAVAADKAALEVGLTGSDSTLTSVTANLVLPTVGSQGTTMVWSSSYTRTVSTTGVVTQASAATPVTLTARVTRGTAADTKDFAVNVQPGPAIVPKTGQTTSYAGGDDGLLQRGVAWPGSRFEAIGSSGTLLRDNLTGLVWERNPGVVALAWTDALAYCGGITSEFGWSDWRLPNMSELQSLIDDNQTDCTTWLMTQGFTNLQAAFYWSSTGRNATATYCMDLSNYVGGPPGWGAGDKCFMTTSESTKPLYALAVRGGEPGGAVRVPWTGKTTSYGTEDDGALRKGLVWPLPRFIDNRDGTVTDKLTGLMWEKSPSAVARTWAEALAYAGALPLCGYYDWRLPNRNEILSLWNYEDDPGGWLNTHGFAGVKFGEMTNDAYWSSTTCAFDTGLAWSVAMYKWGIRSMDKTLTCYAWAVRGGR